MYEGVGVYPMRGESCSAWGRDCEYLNQCTLNNKYITTPLTSNDVIVDDKVYDIQLTLMDLINAQMNKNTASSQDIEGEL
jgi:hypothetical protein